MFSRLQGTNGHKQKSGAKEAYRGPVSPSSEEEEEEEEEVQGSWNLTKAARRDLFCLEP
jgi:hypothetical protein